MNYTIPNGNTIPNGYIHPNPNRRLRVGGQSCTETIKVSFFLSNLPYHTVFTNVPLFVPDRKTGTKTGTSFPLTLPTLLAKVFLMFLLFLKILVVDYSSLFPLFK